MGKADTPVRRLFNLGMKTFASSLPVAYIQTVCTVGENDQPVLQGLFAGDEYSVFEEACALSNTVNIAKIDRPASLVVARTEESSFWLGNKAIYRSRMMIANGGTLVVIAPNLRCCAEDPSLEHVIRELGYRGTETVLGTIAEKQEAPGNLAAKAHLIHGSSEGRFNVIYAVPASMTKLVESVGYQAMEIGQALKMYGGFNREGWSTSQEGHEYYHLPFPASGLWKARRSSS
jgi:hypothetical protein